MARTMFSRLQLAVVLSSLLAAGCLFGTRAAEMTTTLIVAGSHIDITVEDEKTPSRKPT